MAQAQGDPACWAQITAGYVCPSFFRYYLEYILSKGNELSCSWCNYILGNPSLARDLLGHTSGEFNHINDAGRQAGTVPEQSGQNESKSTRKRGIALT